MSRYRKVKLHLKQLKELQSIITSMRTLAQLESRKLARFTRSQNNIADVLDQTITDFLTFFPRQPLNKENALWLLIGSERGFCGGFNEQLISRLFTEWPRCLDKPQRVLAVGHKLCSRLDEMLPGYEGMTGASVVEEIPSLLSRVVNTTQKQLIHHSSATLRVLYHSDEHRKVVYHQLLPLREYNYLSNQPFHLCSISIWNRFSAISCNTIFFSV